MSFLASVGMLKNIVINNSWRMEFHVPSTGITLRYSGKRLVTTMTKIVLTVSGARGDAKNSFSLTWEFYQAMVGSPLMSLYGWRQFAETSIDYSCLSEEEKERARRILKDDFMKFHKWIIKEYQTYAAGLNLAEKESL